MLTYNNVEEFHIPTLYYALIHVSNMTTENFRRGDRMK